MLKDRLKAPREKVEERIARLIADLDDNAFDVREKASLGLQRLDGIAEPALRRTLDKTESAEVRTRVRALLEKLNSPTGPPSDALIRLRALEAVANMGTPEARELLKELAKGDAADPQTQEAQASLKRLERR